MIKFRRYFKPDDDAGGGGGSAVATAPAAAPAAQAPAAPAAPAAPSAARAPNAPAAPAGAPAGVPPADEGYWKADWRDRLAGGDDKLLKQLQRYASPEAVWQKARALEAKVSAGELKPTLGKNANAEELAEFRKSNGIPEAAEKYDLTGIAIDEPDKPLVDQVLKAAHGAHASPDVVKAVVGVWPKIKQAALEAQTRQDTKAKTESEDALRAEWGGEFRRNISLVHQLLDGSGDAEIKDQVLNGRLADGTPIGSSVKALKMLLGVALAQNPAGAIIPGGGGDPMGSLNDEIAKVEKLMRTNRDEYNRDEKMQENYRRLLAARESLGNRK